MTAPGLRVVLEPTVEAAFLRHDGLMNPLRGLVEDEELPTDELEVARHLLAVVTTPKGSSGDAAGNARAAAPDLAAELGDDLSLAIADELVAASETAPNLLRTLNNAAKTRARLRARESDPIVDRLLERVIAGLDRCPGLDGTALEEFTEMLTYILKVLTRPRQHRSDERRLRRAIPLQAGKRKSLHRELPSTRFGELT